MESPVGSLEKEKKAKNMGDEIFQIIIFRYD